MPLIRPFAVDDQTFRSHLDLIVERELRSLTVTGFLDAVAAQDHELLSRSVVITFDDGFADFATAALPSLRERGLAVTLFLATGLLGAGRYMLDWSQLAELHAAGVELGGHSHTHPQLDTLSPGDAREEVVRCKTLLEETLGAPVETFAYPHGYSSPRLRRLVHEVGYRGACAVKDAFSSEEDDELALARLMLRADTPVAEVEQWLDRRGAPPPPRHEAMRTRGWRAYRRARAVVTRRPGRDPGWPEVSESA